MSVILLLISFAMLCLVMNRVKYEPEPSIASDDVKAAMMKMGPGYQYRITDGETLRVNKGDGKWLRLNYKRKEDKK